VVPDSIRRGDRHPHFIETAMPQLLAVSDDGNQVVWAISWIADERWRTVVKPFGAREWSVEDPDKYYDSIIEAVDLPSSTVIASVRVDSRIQGFIGPGLAYAYRENAAGMPRWDMVRLRLNRR